MKTLHEWQRERRHCEGLWLVEDKLAQFGMSNVNPLDYPKRKEKPKSTVSPIKTLKAKPAAKALKQMPGIGVTRELEATAWNLIHLYGLRRS